MSKGEATADPFYRDFEDRWRGDPQLIRSRLGFYRCFAQPLLSAWGQPDAQALDLGCGRGEWVRLLGEMGFTARGVDRDPAMLEHGAEMGLRLEHGDALHTLRATPAGSLALVSALHVVEHLRFEVVRELVDEALRCLAPGGLLVLETPNPENLVVGAFSFYVDPTHVRPLPSELLAFVTDHAGFMRSKVARLNEPQRLDQGRRLGLIDVFEGVSPDYAVIAQKRGPTRTLACLDDAFTDRYGYKLGHLALAYEHQRDAEHDALNARIAALQTQMTQLGEHYARQAQLDELNARIAELEAFRAEVSHSVAWRISRRLDPMAQRLVSAVRGGRILSGVLRRLAALPRRLASRLARSPARRWIVPVLNRAPRVKQALRGVADVPLPTLPPAVDRSVVLTESGRIWAHRLEQSLGVEHSPQRDGDAPSR